MPAYRFAGLTLACAFPFPELPSASARRSALRITLGKRRVRDATHEWQHRWCNGGRIWMRLARRGETRVIQFPGLGEFEIRGRSIVCYPRTKIPLRTIRHLLLNQVLPATLASSRSVVLHASAVEIGGRAIGFLGPAGAGKSTIAGALVRHGASTVTDDALVIHLAGSNAIAVPTYPGLRLWPDSRAIIGTWPAIRRVRVAHYTRKQRWSGPSVPFASRPVKLAALYLLTRGKTVCVRALSGRQSIMALIRYSMMLDATNASAVKNGFDLVAAIVSRVEVSRLTVPRGKRGIAAICEAIGGRSGRR